VKYLKNKLFRLAIFSLFFLFLTGCQNTAQQRPIMPDTNQVQPQNTADMTDNERRMMADRLADLAESENGVRKAIVVVSTIGMADNMPRNNNNNRFDNTIPQNTPLNNMNNGRINDGVLDNNANGRMNGANNINGRMNGTLNNNNNFNNNMTNNNMNGDSANGIVVMVGLTLDDNRNMNEMDIKRRVANRIKNSDPRISQVLVTTDQNLMQRINNVASGLVKGIPIDNFRNDLNDLSNRIEPII
jgi:hypothetical protein